MGRATVVRASGPTAGDVAVGLGVVVVLGSLVAGAAPPAASVSAADHGFGDAAGQSHGHGAPGPRSPWAAFTVDDTSDAPDADPGDGRCASPARRCTLRAAVMEANALPGPDTVLLPAGVYVLGLVGEGAAAGDLDISDHMTLRGAGPDSRVVAAVPGQRVLQVSAAGAVREPEVVLADLTIGGGDSTVGGGVYATAGTLRVARVEVVGNSADLGGGIMVTDGARLELWASTVAGNVARQGGGVFVGIPLGAGDDITSSLANSTLSGNRADVGGGLAVAGPARLTSVTIAGNAASSGAGAFASGSLVLASSVIASNVGGADCADAGDEIASRGHNADGDGSCHLDGARGDLAAVEAALGPLAWNGGPTRTRMPAPDSPLLDAGAGCPATDQRGVPRPQGAACDIGAVEREDPPPAPTPSPTVAATPGPVPTATMVAAPTATATVLPHPTATATTSPPPKTTVTASPSPSPISTATAGSSPEATAAAVCPQIRGRVPESAIAAALGDPSGVAGWGWACNPNVPVSPLNPLRTWLSLRNPAQSYHPLFNGLAYRCGCP